MCMYTGSSLSLIRGILSRAYMTSWEFLNSLEPDLDILLARRPFRPAQLVYFACRYANLAFLIGTSVYCLSVSETRGPIV